MCVPVVDINVVSQNMKQASAELLTSVKFPASAEFPASAKFLASGELPVSAHILEHFVRWHSFLLLFRNQVCSIEDYCRGVAQKYVNLLRTRIPRLRFAVVYSRLWTIRNPRIRETWIPKLFFRSSSRISRNSRLTICCHRKHGIRNCFVLIEFRNPVVSAALLMLSLKVISGICEIRKPQVVLYV